MSSNQNFQPPKWADKLLEWFCRTDRLEQVQGDLHELFFLRVEEKGQRIASLSFIWDMTKSFRWENLKRNKTQINIAMIFNYLKVGWRNLKGQKIPSFINIFGLSCAIACSIVAYMFVSSKIHRDRFHTNADNIYMLTHTAQVKDETIRFGMNAEVIGEQIQNEVSDFKRIVRMRTDRALVKRKNDVFFESIDFIDPSFYEMFDFPLKYGSIEELEKPDRIAITTLAAAKYFGEDYPIGEQLQISISGQSKTLVIGAVIEPAPENSTIDFNFLINYELIKGFYPEEQVDACVMVQLEQPVEEVDLSGFARLIELNNGLNPENPYLALQLEPLKTINDNSNIIRGGLGHGSNPAPMIVLSIIAILLLLLAVFNYLNIAIMMATKRIKEIGTRKVMGAKRNQVVFQFLIENLIVCFFALLLGVFIASNFFIPWFNTLSDGAHKIDFFDPNIWYFLITVLFVIGLTSGTYPAWYISSFQPAMIFKGANQTMKKNGFTSSLLTFQFTLALITIVAGSILIQTNRTNKQRDWGYNYESIIVLNTPSLQDHKVLKEKLSAYPEVISVASNTHTIGDINAERMAKIGSEQFQIDCIEGAYNYAQVMGLRLEKGRFFEKYSTTDKSTGILVNSTFMKEFAIDFKDQPNVMIDSSNYHILGVVQDFHQYDFARKIVPTAIMISGEERFKYLSIEVASEKALEMFEKTREVYHSQNSDIPFYGYIQSSVFEHYFKDVKSISDLLVFTSFLAIILSVMGLYGLVSLIISNSMKIFSIKKVLGANNRQLSAKLYRKFVIMLCISAVIGGLVSMKAITMLLKDIYSYHDELSVLHVFAALILLSTVVLLTIFGLMNKLKNTNPADILRVE